MADHTQPEATPHAAAPTAAAPTAAATWRCPACDTYNTGDDCIVCDHRKDAHTLPRLAVTS
jgi:hypothetical protein